MARLFRVIVDCHPPSDTRPAYCVEVWEGVRTRRPERMLHFGFEQTIDGEDADWIVDCVRQELLSVLHRTVGIQGELNF